MANDNSKKGSPQYQTNQVVKGRPQYARISVMKISGAIKIHDRERVSLSLNVECNIMAAIMINRNSLWLRITDTMIVT